MNKLKFSKAKVMTLLIIVGCQSNHLPIDERWMHISGKRELSVSGIATTTIKDTYLVVHDNKKKDQPRAGLVNLSADSLYSGLGWPVKELPIDLESLTNNSSLEPIAENIQIIPNSQMKLFQPENTTEKAINEVNIETMTPLEALNLIETLKKNLADKNYEN